MIFCFQGTPSSNEPIDFFQRLQIILAVSPFFSTEDTTKTLGKPRNFFSSTFWPKLLRITFLQGYEYLMR